MLRVFFIGCILMYSAAASYSEVREELAFRDLLNGELEPFRWSASVISEGDTLSLGDRAAIDEQAKRLSQAVGRQLTTAKALLDSLQEVESKSLKIRRLELLEAQLATPAPGDIHAPVRKEMRETLVTQQIYEAMTRVERLADSAAHLEGAIRKLGIEDLRLIRVTRAER